jgi:hypothetical protein
VNPPVASGQIPAELQRLFDYDLVVEGDKTNVPLDGRDGSQMRICFSYQMLVT